MTLYGSLTTSVSPSDTPRVVPGDPDDDHVIAVGVTAEADLIVSGDRHLLTLGTHRGMRILTRAEALALIGY